MADLEDDKELEKDLDTEVDTEPEAPKDPIDKNADVEVQVGPSRQEKKRNRLREFEERTTRAEKAAEEARNEAREARERFDRLNQHPQSHQQPQPQVNPVQQRLGQIAEAKRRLHETYEAVASQPGYDRNGPRQKEFERQAEELENARVATISDANRPQVNEQELMRKVALQAYLDSHSDISSDPNKFKWALARWEQRKAEGHADTREMADEVFDEARVKFGGRARNRIGPQRPDPATQRRLSGVSAQSTGAPDNVGSIRMNAMERKMAEVKYDNLPKEKAWQKWANNEGKKVMERRAGK
jgi:hypothetical protein